MTPQITTTCFKPNCTDILLEVSLDENLVHLRLGIMDTKKTHWTLLDQKGLQALHKSITEALELKKSLESHE